MVPFLLACANNGGGQDDPEPDPEEDTEVTEDEFSNAVNNVGETYLQAKLDMTVFEEDENEIVEVKTIMDAQSSPTKSYFDRIQDTEHTTAYGVLDDDKTNVTMATKYGDNPWEEQKMSLEIAIKSNIWVTPSTYSAHKMTYNLCYVDIVFDDFEYNQDNKLYFHEYKNVSDVTEYYGVSISFLDNKAVKVNIVCETEDPAANERVKNMEGSISYTYDKVDPKDPRK